MSRQSKAAKKKVLAKQFTAIHKGGSKGPSATKKQTKKVNTWFRAKRAGRPISHNSYSSEDEGI